MTDAGMKPSQTGAGRLIGISQPSVNDWTLGKHPTMENAIALAAKLNVNVEWLLTERGPKRPVPSDSYAQKLWALWPELSEGDKRELFARAEGWLQRRQDGQEDDRQPSRTGLAKS
jgi:hypothetical protein